MTTEERLDRIEHVSAGLAEERRKDREESRQLWRDTQRQLNDTANKINDLTLKIADTNDAIARLAEESRAADQRPHERINGLTSAIGQLIVRIGIPPQA